MASSRSPLLHRFAPHVAELPVARRALRDWLAGAPHDGEAADELLVVVTELCTNAVRQAPSGLVTLRAWEEADAVVVEVEGLSSVSAASDEDERAALLVRSLCDDLMTVIRGRSRFVRCRKAFRQPAQ